MSKAAFRSSDTRKEELPYMVHRRYGAWEIRYMEDMVRGICGTCEIWYMGDMI